MWCKLRTRVRKFAVHLGVDIRVNWARARFTNRPFLVLFRVSMVRISRVSWVRVRVRVRLALVLGLMSSVCMTYSNVCRCACVQNACQTAWYFMYMLPVAVQ